MVTLIAAICGVVFGFSGLLLGILNYVRDRSKLIVKLQWDMAVTDNPIYDPKKSWGVVRVTNVGRRPAHLANVALRLPKTFKTPAGFDCDHLMLMESAGGKKLAEADPQAVFFVAQDSMVQYSAIWRQLRAVAEDSMGKTYKSKKVSKQPSWVKPA